jgi:IS5 family transposase
LSPFCHGRWKIGQVHDVTQAEPLLEDLAPNAVIADKGCDSDAFVERLEARDITPLFPPKASRNEIRACDRTASATSLSASSIKSSTTGR